MTRKLVFLAILVAVAWYLWAGPISAPMAEDLALHVDAPSGFDRDVALHNPPVQTNFTQRPVIEVGDFRFTLMADFQLEARVLSRRDYRRDAGAKLSPIDLALGWGAMARPEIVEQFDIRQRGRWYFWHADEYPIPMQEVISSSANMHLVPGSPAVFDELRRVRNGDTVRLRGYLVNIDRDDGWRWRTSMVRTDTGDGSCELVLVTLAEIVY